MTKVQLNFRKMINASSPRFSKCTHPVHINALKSALAFTNLHTKLPLPLLGCHLDHSGASEADKCRCNLERRLFQTR